MTLPIPFSGGDWDRAAALRSDPAWLAAQVQAGLFLPVWRGAPLVADDKLMFLPWRPEWEASPRVFLGLEAGRALFAVAVETEGPDLGAFVDMRSAAHLLPPRDCAMAGQAKSMLHWHERHRFCANCGVGTDVSDGGWKRVCPNCGAEHFPRTDPVAIMLPVFEDRCLVGRNARFPGGLYSAFAGFVEPGETLEEAVSRELLEEVALPVGAVRYHRSQPWPFPSSLMLGCYAEALTPEFRVDGVEIVDARWLTRDEVLQRLAGTIQDEMTMPGRIAVAHYLIREWAESAGGLRPLAPGT